MWTVLLAASTVGDVSIATIAAVASVVNTYMLARTRSTQKDIRQEVARLQHPVSKLQELSDERRYQIEELQTLNRALANRIGEIRRALGVTGETDVTDR